MAKKEELKEMYYWYKSKNICVKCGKEKARKGYTTCFECAEKDTLSSKDYYHNKMTEDQYKRRLAYNKRKRDLCIAFGLCRDCLKRDATRGKFCLECYIKYTRRNQEKRQKEGKVSRSHRTENGLCYFCGKEVEEGKSTCPTCYKNRKLAILRNRMVDTGSHIWRDLDATTFLRNQQSKQSV